MTYISSHPEVSYKKVFQKFMQNSQEDSCSEVYFSCIFNKKRGSGTAGFLWIFRNWFDPQNTKNKFQMFPKKVYICYVYT